jgi:hypothetical protein
VGLQPTGVSGYLDYIKLRDGTTQNYSSPIHRQLRDGRSKGNKIDLAILSLLATSGLHRTNQGGMSSKGLVSLT